MSSAVNVVSRAMKARHVSICICTYKRPALLLRLLKALEGQETDGSFSYSVVVADNDANRSAETTVADFAHEASIEVAYCCETNQNIALARNAALRQAAGELIGFIDDDEFPVEDWLIRMVRMLDDPKFSGVLGPVRPHFEEEPPEWIVKGGFCDRPEHSTGKILAWGECRSGNLLFRRKLIDGDDEPFDAKFGNGGEDMEFFLQMTEAGHVFVWCNEAIAYESVPPSRLTRRFMLRRALLRGKNILKQTTGRWRKVLVSLVAAPIYLVLAPLLLIRGQHWFMKYCIKLCDHSGRLLAIVGLNPISDRGI